MIHSSPEFASLKRPKVSRASDTGILRVIYGIPWTVFSLLFLFTTLVEPYGIGMFLIYFITALTSTVFGIYLLLGGVKARLLSLELDAKGRLTEAIVFDRWKEPGADHDKYYVAYAYRIPFFHSEAPMITNAEQSYAAYNRLNVGDTVTVRYLKNKTGVSKMILPYPEQITRDISN